MTKSNWIEWRPDYDGHKPDMKTVNNVEWRWGTSSNARWNNFGRPLWSSDNVYRFPAEDLRGHNGGPVEDAFELPNDLLIEPVVNPKELAGVKKPASWSVMPRWVMLQVGRVMSVGAAKYGVFNYRDSSISASVYQDAIERHLQLWFDGEDTDDETGVSHLASVIASCSLLMDAQETGKLNDDRQKTGIVRRTLKDLEQLLITLPLPQPKTGA